MKKLFISADIEGTAGIAHWDETEQGKMLYPHFARQMSREVAAACEGALSAGLLQNLRHRSFSHSVPPYSAGCS